MARGWKDLDILLITGDAYIDHPSFGIALIGRLLTHHGYKVAILAQPRTDSTSDFTAFPCPRLFCGITAGNLDSIVANYTGNGRVRENDAYSPDGNPYRTTKKEKQNRRRPDRATLVYTSLAKAAFAQTPVVLGGIEASLRRFVHYDYQQAKLRGSFLTDAKADILVYGMGEKAILEIAKRLHSNLPLDEIAGTCRRLTERECADLFGSTSLESSREMLVLPSLQQILADNKNFLVGETALDRHLRAYSNRIVLQKQQTHWVIQYPQPKPLTTAELDQLYELPFTRKPHPENQNIPAHKMIADSVTIVRGCSGNCSFCAITRHQGPAITSRSEASIVRECTEFSRARHFSGTISDLGGPTANLYGTGCAIGSCKKRDCLYPEPCPNLEIDEKRFLSLLEKVGNLEKVNHLFISSGLRMELLLQTPRLMRKIIAHHTPGAIKIAPEHTCDDLLELMHKEPHKLLQNFVTRCRELAKQTGNKSIELTPYIITSHPGSTPDHAGKLASDLKKLGLTARKFQDFTPTPGTLSTAMYVTGLRADTLKPIPVSRNRGERNRERKILESMFHPKNKGSVKRKNGRYAKKKR